MPRRSAKRRTSRDRQRGWAGLVVTLIVLAIVAWLAKDQLKAYGLIPGNAVATKAGTPGERARAPGAMGIETLDVEAAPPSAGSALERARGVEEMVKKQAEERGARMDEAGK